MNISCRDDEHSSWTIPAGNVIYVTDRNGWRAWLLSDMKILELPSSSYPSTSSSPATLRFRRSITHPTFSQTLETFSVSVVIEVEVDAYCKMIVSIRPVVTWQITKANFQTITQLPCVYETSSRNSRNIISTVLKT